MPATWTSLTAAVKTWAEQDFTDAQAQEFIGLAEEEFQCLIFTPDRESPLSITANALSETLPTDFWGFKSGPYIDGDMDTGLTRVTAAELRALYPDTTQTGTPWHYAIEGESILFGPVPSEAFTIKGTYYVTIPVLGASVASNWLLTDHYRLYLAGALVWAFRFHMDEQRAGYWTNIRDRLIQEVNNAGVRRANSGPLVPTSPVSNVAGVRA